MDGCIGKRLRGLSGGGRRGVGVLALAIAALAAACSPREDSPEQVASVGQSLNSSLTLRFTRLYIGNFPCGPSNDLCNVDTLYSASAAIGGVGPAVSIWSCPVGSLGGGFGELVPPPEGQQAGSDGFCRPPNFTNEGKADIAELFPSNRTTYTFEVPPGVPQIPMVVSFTHGERSIDNFTWSFEVDSITGGVTFEPVQGNVTAEMQGSAFCARGPDDWMLCWEIELACVPTGLPDDNCDNVDDDCDGVADDDYQESLSCGPPGECSGTLQLSCVDGQVVPGTCVGVSLPGTEICDGKDNDCDDIIDNNIEVPAGACAPGRCTEEAVASCGENGTINVVCGVAVAEQCDGADNDCDGVTDNDPAFDAAEFCQGECANDATATCVGTELSVQCGEPEEEICDTLDHDCDGDTDTEAVPAGECGLGACRRQGLDVCVDGMLSNVCAAGAPTPEVFDLEDNDCDGLVNECGDGQGDWWCCSETGQAVLEFNVVSGPDVAPAEQCVPLSEDPDATCSLRGVFQVAQQSVDNGCQVVAHVGAGTYELGSELRLGRGDLTLLGDGASSTTITTTAPCSVPDPSRQDPETGEDVPTCNDEAKTDPTQCDNGRPLNADHICCQGLCGERSCSAQADHRLISAVSDGESTLSLRLEDIALVGGNDTAQGATVNAGGGGVLFKGGNDFIANRAVVRDNRARGRGAGLHVALADLVRITDSVIRDNVNRQVTCAKNMPGGGVTGDGGGIYLESDGLLEIERTAIVGNIGPDGGGLAAEGAGQLFIRNSTIGKNWASARGGGILTNMETHLEFNTILANEGAYQNSTQGADRGAGLATDAAATVFAFGNILSDNDLADLVGQTRSDDCSFSEGASATAALNLISVGGLDCEPLGAPDGTLIGMLFERVSAEFVNDWWLPFTADSTAFAQVVPLQAQSPAIGAYPALGSEPAGAPACPLTDQRGYLRPLDAPCTLGAYEANGIPDSDGDGIADSVDAEPLIFSSFFSDVELFGNTDGTLEARGDQVLAVRNLDGLTQGVVIQAASDGGSVPAEISACNGSVQESLQAGERITITCPRPTSCLFSEQDLTVFDRAEVHANAFAQSFTVYHDARLFGDVTSLGDGFLWDRATIAGDATLGGVLGGHRAGVEGDLFEGASVSPQAPIVRTTLAGGADVTVPFDGFESLAPGGYGDVLVHSGATLELSGSGVFQFRSLTFEPDAFLNAASSESGVVVAVDGDLVLGDRLVMSGSGQGGLEADQLLFYTNGELVWIGHDTRLVGQFEAPFAELEVNDRSMVAGCIGAKRVTIRHDSSVGDGELSTPPPLPPPFTAAIVPTGDWGNGYCAAVVVENDAPTATTTWNVGLELQGTQIFDTWNGYFSGDWSSGPVTVTPSEPWNMSIQPGASNDTVGFCAHRPGGGSAIAAVSDASGSY